MKPAPAILRFPTRPDGQIRVLFVRSVSGNGGGPESIIFSSARHLPALGVQAEALYLLDANQPCDGLLARARAAAMPVHVAMEKSALDPAGASAFARLVRGGHFDIVHTNDYKANALARLLSVTGEYRIVATSHGYNQTTSREAYYYAMDKLLLRRADAVICPSQALADLLTTSGVSRRRISVIPNGIELDRWPFRSRRPRAGAARVFYVGRLSAEKNVAALLEACSLLLAQGQPLRLHLAGDGPQDQPLRRRVRELGLESAVEFLGHCQNVPDLLAQADLLVNPSLTEAMPCALLEALAAGVPVVATDVGDVGRLILHEQTGLLVPPGDVPSLAQAMGTLLARPDFAQHLAVQGRRHVEAHFDFAANLAHVVAIYRGVLAMARRTA